MLRFITGALLVAGLSAISWVPPASGQQPAKKPPSRNDVIRTIHRLKHGKAEILAKMLSRHFEGDAIFAGELSSNGLLIRANNAEVLQEIMALLDRIDRGPEMVGIEVLMVDVIPDLTKNPTRNPPPAKPDDKGFSGTPVKVQAYLAGLAKKSNKIRVRRIHLSALEHKSGLIQMAADQPYITATSLLTTGGVKRVNNRINYRPAGTLLKVTPRIIRQGVIEIDFSLEDSKIHTPPTGIQIGTDENDRPIRASEFPIMIFRSKLTLPEGQAMLVHGFHKSVPVRSHVYLIVTGRVLSTNSTGK